VVPGETALAFYKAKNPTNEAIIGISTYNILPYDAGQYFNKIQVLVYQPTLKNRNLFLFKYLLASRGTA
jgi:cytochrome c oxidase assembly protein Cox11